MTYIGNISFFVSLIVPHEVLIPENVMHITWLCYDSESKVGTVYYSYNNYDGYHIYIQIVRRSIFIYIYTLDCFHFYTEWGDLSVMFKKTWPSSVINHSLHNSSVGSNFITMNLFVIVPLVTVSVAILTGKIINLQIFFNFAHIMGI